MKYLAFENGDKMPALGLGTWKSAKGEVYAAVRAALEIGLDLHYRYIKGNFWCLPGSDYTPENLWDE